MNQQSGGGGASQRKRKIKIKIDFDFDFYLTKSEWGRAVLFAGWIGLRGYGPWPAMALRGREDKRKEKNSPQSIMNGINQTNLNDFWWMIDEINKWNQKEWIGLCWWNGGAVRCPKRAEFVEINWRMKLMKQMKRIAQPIK